MVTLGLMFLDMHRHVEFWSSIPQRRALQTGERPQLGQPECLQEFELARTGFFACYPEKKATHTHILKTQITRN